MFGIFKKRTNVQFDETPWEAARKDDTLAISVPEIEINEDSEELIMDMSKTTWVAITGEEVIDLRLNGERLGTTALACFDRQLRIRKSRLDSCSACQAIPSNKCQTVHRSPSEDVTPDQSINTSPVAPKYNSSSDNYLVSDSDSCSSSIGWIDQDSNLSNEDSSESSSSTDEDQTSTDWDSPQESRFATLSSFNFSQRPNYRRLSHNGKRLISYLCPICHVPYAPKEYFNVHLRQVHGNPTFEKSRIPSSGITSQPLRVTACRAGKRIRSGGSTIKNSVIEPERPNKNYIPSKRHKKGDETNGVSVKTDSTCKSYEDVLHQCPFCKAPFPLKDLAIHFERVHTTELKLIQDGKDWLAKQSDRNSVDCSSSSQNKVMYIPEEHKVKMYVRQPKNEDSIVKHINVTDQISNYESQKSNISHSICENAHQEMDAKSESAAQLELCYICGSFSLSDSNHIEIMHQMIEYSPTNNVTSSDSNLKDSTTNKKCNVITMDSPKTTNENNATIQTVLMDVNNFVEMPNDSSTSTTKNNVMTPIYHVNMSNDVVKENWSGSRNLTTNESNEIIPITNTTLNTCLLDPATLSDLPNILESNMIVPKLHMDTRNLIKIESIRSLSHSINTREHNSIVSNECKAYRCIGCGFLLGFSEQQTDILPKLCQAVKNRCQRCHLLNSPFSVNALKKNPVISSKLMSNNSICKVWQKEMLVDKNVTDSAKCHYIRLCNEPTRTAPSQPCSSDNNLSSEAPKPKSNCEYSITIKISPPQPETSSIGCPLCNSQLDLTEIQIHSLTILHEMVQCLCPKCEVWSMLQLPVIKPKI